MHINHTTTRLRWKKDFVSSCYVGRVFHVLRHRNSYNWSSSINYFGGKSFYSDIDDAKIYVQKNREKGSSWTIEEYPALVISGIDYALCLANADCDEQFGYLSDIEITHKSLDKIAKTFLKHSNGSTFLYRIRCGEVEALTRPLVRYSSQRFGGVYDLQWEIDGKSCARLSDIFELQKKIWNLI